MRRSIQTLLTCAVLACTLTLSSQAQERTAGSTVETQMTWSALSTQINAVKTKTELVNSRVDQAVVCGKQGLLYAPDAPGNVGGCLQPKTDPSVTNNITKIIQCNKSGQTYDGTKCVALTATSDSRWIVNTSYAGKTYLSNSMSASGAIDQYKKVYGYPWAIPDCDTLSGVSNGRKCASAGQLCYLDAYTATGRQGNCSSCNTISGYNVTANYTQYKCD